MNYEGVLANSLALCPPDDHAVHWGQRYSLYRYGEILIVFPSLVNCRLEDISRSTSCLPTCGPGSRTRYRIRYRVRQASGGGQGCSEIYSGYEGPFTDSQGTYFQKTENCQTRACAGYLNILVNIITTRSEVNLFLLPSQLCPGWGFLVFLLSFLWWRNQDNGQMVENTGQWRWYDLCWKISCISTKCNMGLL